MKVSKWGELSSLESGIDVIGDIAVVKLRKEADVKDIEIARAVLDEMKNVRCVYGQEGSIEGDFRLRKLRHLGGEERTTTLHKENGLRLKLDIETCYFSPRLSTERLRIAKDVERGERVLNMFAGVGPFSILIAKKTRVWSCELNTIAFDFHIENNKLNKVEGDVEMIRGDAIGLPERVAGGEAFERILMPHPSQANLFLPAAMKMLAPHGVIHYYRHMTGEDEGEAKENLSREIRSFAPALSVSSVRRVRVVGPRYIELVADLRNG